MLTEVLLLLYLYYILALLSSYTRFVDISSKSAVQNPTYNQHASSDLPDPMGDLYTKIDKHVRFLSESNIHCLMSFIL